MLLPNYSMTSWNEKVSYILHQIDHFMSFIFSDIRGQYSNKSYSTIQFLVLWLEETTSTL